MSLTAPQLVEQLDRLRPRVLAAVGREFPRLTGEDLEDLYSQAVEEVLRNRRRFENQPQLIAYLRRAVANYARNTLRARSRTPSTPLDAGSAPFEVPDPSAADLDDVVMVGQARVVLWEYLAEQASDQDRTIAYLAFDPAHELKALQIARALDLPHKQVVRTVNRTRLGLSRFAAYNARPGAFCHRRRGDVLEWQRTGTVPLALRVHMAHCRSCRDHYRAAGEAARHAILPLLPATAVPVAAGARGLGRVYAAVATHPLTHRADDALGRWRKMAPVGGGGGAVVAVKLATAGAIVTFGAAGAWHALNSTPRPTRPTPRARSDHQRRAHPPRPAAVRSATLASHPVLHRAPIVAATTTRPHATITTTRASTSTSATTTTTRLPPVPDASVALTRREQQTGRTPPVPDESTASTNSTGASKTAAASTGSGAGSASGSGGSRGATNISGPPAPGGPPPP